MSCASPPCDSSTQQLPTHISVRQSECPLCEACEERRIEECHREDAALSTGSPEHRSQADCFAQEALSQGGSEIKGSQYQSGFGTVMYILVGFLFLVSQQKKKRYWAK